MGSNWFTFIEGFEVELEYLPQAVLEGIYEVSSKIKCKKGQVDKTNRAVAGHILNWKLTKEALGKIFSIKEGAKIDGEVECSEANKIYVIENAYGFDDFILDRMVNIHGFRGKQ